MVLADGEQARVVPPAERAGGFPEGRRRMSSGSARNVVLVHGGFAGGSGWQAVHDLLARDGYRVAVVQSRPCPWRTTPP